MGIPRILQHLEKGEEFSELLKEMIKEKGLTQDEYADKKEGLTVYTLRSWLQGQRFKKTPRKLLPVIDEIEKWLENRET